MTSENGKPEDLYTLKAVLQRFEGRKAILFSEILGEIAWPIRNLPDDVQVGDWVTLKISSSKTKTDEKLDKMRQLLEELVNQ